MTAKPQWRRELDRKLAIQRAEKKRAIAAYSEAELDLAREQLKHTARVLKRGEVK